MLETAATGRTFVKSKRAKVFIKLIIEDMVRKLNEMNADKAILGM